MRRALFGLLFLLWGTAAFAQSGPFSGQIQRALAAYPPSYAADPGSCTGAFTPRVYYNSSLNVIKFCNGSSWLTFADTSVSGAPFDDGTAIVKGSSDSTKLLRIEVDGFTTGTTRIMTPPNADFNAAGLNIANTWTQNQTFSGTTGFILNASTIGFFAASTAHTPDTAIFYTGTTSEMLHIKQFGDAASDMNNCHAGTSASSYPTLCLHGPAANTTNWVDLGHNDTDAVLAVGTGGIDYTGTTGTYKYDRTITSAGTTGARTINKTAGTVNFAAGASTLVVTNSLVTTSSIVFAVVRTADTTALIKNVVPASGSFTITLNANATAETSVGFFVTN